MAFGPHWFKRDTDESQEAARQRALLDGMRAIKKLRDCEIMMATPPTGLILDEMFEAYNEYVAADGKLDD